MFSSLRHLNALRAFESAARNRSIAKAATELHVSHSVVSQHVRNLEEWLGVSLFERHSNRIELSEDGKHLEPQIAYGLQILSDACDNLLRLSQSGTVNISAEPAIASRWLRKKITEFCDQHPKIECNLRSEWRTPSIDEDQVDLIVHFEERLLRSRTESDRLFPIDGFPAMAKSKLDPNFEPEAEGNLVEFPLIHDNGRHIWQHWFTEFTKEGKRWKEGKVHSDLSLAIEAAVDGEGLVLADNIICGKELASEQLVKVDDRTIRCTWYRVAIEENAPSNSAAIVLRDWLVTEAQKEDFAI
ncbi:LysR family transcriptional regulator [Cognatishimia maritima]|uniref:LysR family transcriptional regulator, glycine cleavage system transcriptional activator n=1 Tax=Cognatishimia maritima TaxID=870908 RepID=A0A1M5Q9R2_9RHOB|nr:LysR family transcriptional regulator [Cognatishimia maritima]SHH10243.1 LysR family transcriptional regulator, glycine cleavage system transcriptional activator [Cognatishimia maritima]